MKNKKFIGRIKNQRFLILSGTYKNIWYESDAVETVEIDGKYLQCQSVMRFKKKGSLLTSTARFISLKNINQDIWNSYPTPPTNGSGFKSSHIPTEDEINLMIKKQLGNIQ
jgi:hypothetical protein